MRLSSGRSRVACPLLRRRGQGLTEYFFILLLVVLAVITALESFGYDIRDFFDEASYNVMLVRDGRGDEVRGTTSYSWTPGAGIPASP